MIGLGVLAVAGIAYYMYKKPKATSTSTEPTSKATGSTIMTSEGRVPRGMKKCACGLCSKSQSCVDCCAGGGLGSAD